MFSTLLTLQWYPFYIKVISISSSSLDNCFSQATGHETITNRSSRPEVFCEKDVLRNFVKFTGRHLCQSLFLNKVEVLCNFIKETLAQVFSRGFCEISKNTFFTEQLWTPASVFNIFTVIFRHYSITNSRMI